MKRKPLVAVIGSARVDPDVETSAFQVGHALGKAGAHLVCGGRTGVMEAACRGHHAGRLMCSNPGLTIGILKGYDKTEANDFVDVVLPSGLGLARNALIVSTADAVVALSGGSGTLSELALAWQLGKPLVALEPSGGWAQALSGRKLDETRQDKVRQAQTVDEIVFILSEVLGLGT